MREMILNQARSEPDLRRPTTMRINPPPQGSADWRIDLVTAKGEEVRVLHANVGELTLFASELIAPPPPP